MTGQELIDFIISNGLEDYDIGFWREEGDGPDWLYGGIGATINHEEKTVIF